MNSVIITLTGPTCSGKSTLAKFLTEHYGIKEIRSFTTRPMREGEENGREYDFVTEDEYRQMKRDGLVVQDVDLNENHYGSSIANVTEALDGHNICCIVVEPSGVSQFAHAAAKFDWKILPIYIDQPVQRLVERYLQRVRNDKKTPLNFHALRLLRLLDVEAIYWSLDADYALAFDEMDDSVPESNVSKVAEVIVEHARATRMPVRGRLAA